MTPRAILLAWAESGGFAATHGAGATNEAIVADLLAFLDKAGVVIVPREPTDAMLGAGYEAEYSPEDGPMLSEVWELMLIEATR